MAGRKTAALRCAKCGGPMRQGIAIQSTLRGVRDFPSSSTVVTLSEGGPGTVIACLKCRGCGYSVSLGFRQDNEGKKHDAPTKRRRR